MTEHLGHEKNHADQGRESANVRNGIRPKTVLTEATGHVTNDSPRDRNGTLEPQIVKKRQRVQGDDQPPSPEHFVQGGAPDAIVVNAGVDARWVVAHY